MLVLKFFNDSDVKEIADLVAHLGSQPCSQRLTQREMTSPHLPLIAEQTALLRVEQTVRFPVAFSSPGWVKHICRNRDQFRITAISMSDCSEVASLATVALMNLWVVAFLELRRHDLVLPAYQSLSGLHVEFVHANRCGFEFLPTKLIMGDAVPLDHENDDLCVLSDCVCQGR